MRTRLLALGLVLGLLLGSALASVSQPSVSGGGAPGALLSPTCLDATNRDVCLARDAANTLALRNGTSAQQFNLYKTFTDASNYERLEAVVASNIFFVQSNALGTGVGRDLQIGPGVGAGAANLRFAVGGTSQFFVDGLTGNFYASIDNTRDIGTGGANRVRDIYPARNVVGAAGGFFNSVLTNTAAYTAVTGAGCGAATECFFAVGADGKIPAGALNVAKHRIEVELAGVYGANATDTLIVNVKLCQVSGCASGTVITLAATGTVTMSAATAQGWSLRIGCNLFTAGASGTIDCQGIPGALFFSALTTVIVDDVMNSATSTINTTVDEFISASAQWSSTNAANTITLRNFSAKVF